MTYPFIQRLGWILFAVIFYQSGLSFTRYILEAEYSATAWQWAGIIAFPLLLPAFFFVNRYFGCAGNPCPGNHPTEHTGTPVAQQNNDKNKHVLYFRPPG